MLVSLSTFSLLLVATAPESRYTQQQFVVSGCSDPVLEDGPYALLRVRQALLPVLCHHLRSAVLGCFVRCIPLLTPETTLTIAIAQRE